MCEDVQHSGHEKKTLHSVTMDQYRGMRHLEATTKDVTALLGYLVDNVSPECQQLHRYIDFELDDLRGTIEEKRLSLVDETEERAGQMRRMIDEEVERCEAELAAIEEGQLVLDAMSKREGIVQTRMGQLIHGRLSYDDFIVSADVPLHEPPKMLHMLGLQLPMQTLHEVCELMTWTPLSVAAAPQIFPVESKTVESNV